MLDLIGFTDARKCISEGDVGACVSTALNAVPWGKMFKAASKALADGAPAPTVFVDVLGDAGVHARSLLGAVSLRGGLPVIVECLFEVLPAHAGTADGSAVPPL